MVTKGCSLYVQLVSMVTKKGPQSLCSTCVHGNKGLQSLCSTCVHGNEKKGCSLYVQLVSMVTKGRSLYVQLVSMVTKGCSLYVQLVSMVANKGLQSLCSTCVHGNEHRAAVFMFEYIRTHFTLVLATFKVAFLSTAVSPLRTLHN